MLSWSMSYEVGNERIDSQHQMLFRILDDAVEDLLSEKLDVAATLELLRLYARMHFAYEEDVMRRNACPVEETNRREHAAFLGRLEEFDRRFRVAPGEMATVKEFFLWMLSWLKEHVRGVDGELKTVLLNRGGA